MASASRRRNLRIISATYSQAGMFMVRGDSPCRAIADLKGKPIVWGAAASGFIVLARYVMDRLGLDIEKDFEPILLEKAGRRPADRARWARGGDVGRRHRLAGLHGGRERTRGRALHHAERGRNQAHRRQVPFIKPITLMPAGSYPGQDAPVPSLGSWPFVLAAADSPRRCCVPPRARPAQRRSRFRRAARPGARIDPREHARRRAAAGSDPSGRAELHARSRDAALGVNPPYSPPYLEKLENVRR